MCGKFTKFGVATKVIKAEYLMAIMFQTYRSIDKTRLSKFFEEVNYDEALFQNIINKYALVDKLEDFKRKFQ